MSEQKAKRQRPLRWRAGDGADGAASGGGARRPGDVGGGEGVREPGAGGDQLHLPELPEREKPAAFQLRFLGF